jgi:hypothetical protein
MGIYDSRQWKVYCRELQGELMASTVKRNSEATPPGLEFEGRCKMNDDDLNRAGLLRSPVKQGKLLGGHQGVSSGVT